MRPLDENCCSLRLPLDSRRGKLCRYALATVLILSALTSISLRARGQHPLAESGVAIVLSPRLMAGHPATLAVLGLDGKLAPYVPVDLGNGDMVTTDRTGRAQFDVPATGDYLMAKSSGASAAALVDPAVGGSEPSAATLPPIVSIHDRFWICAASLRGDADSNEVKINGQPALVVASSPICLVALPPPGAKPGPAVISIEAPAVKLSVSTVLVSLDFEPPDPALKPNEAGSLMVRAQGSEEKLRIVVQNESPGVLKFERGDVQDLVTSGGPGNSATIRVRAITSGEFALTSQILPTIDSVSAPRYLRAAATLAPHDWQQRILKLANRIAHHPRDAEKVRSEIERIAPGPDQPDFRTLLDAACAAL